MIKETEHFVLTDTITHDGAGTFYLKPYLDTTGLQVQIKNGKPQPEPLLYIRYNEFAGEAYFSTIGSKFQDYITSWELYTELVELLDEGFYRVEFTNQLRDASKDLD